VTGVLAEAAWARGDREKAEKLYCEALDVARRVAGIPKTYTEETYTTQTYNDQTAVRHFLTKVADVLRSRGDILEAEKLDREDFKIGLHLSGLSLVQSRREDLGRRLHLTETSKTPEVEHNVSVELERLGGAFRARDMHGDLDEAEKLYRESLEIRRSLPAELKTAEAELDLAALEFAMAETVEACGNLAEAKKLFGDCIDISRRLAATVKTPEAEHNFLHFLGKVADEARARGDFDEAEMLYREGLDISRRLAAALKTPEDEESVTFFHARLAMTAEACGTKDAACAHWRHAHASAKQLNDRNSTRHSAWMVEYTGKNVDRLCG
jgi:tetratricopeptide (TPR) repeat protein